jgi:hypothetical protein
MPSRSPGVVHVARLRDLPAAVRPLGEEVLRLFGRTLASPLCVPILPGLPPSVACLLETPVHPGPTSMSGGATVVVCARLGVYSGGHTLRAWPKDGGAMSRAALRAVLRVEAAVSHCQTRPEGYRTSRQDG